MLRILSLTWIFPDSAAGEPCTCRGRESHSQRESHRERVTERGRERERLIERERERERERGRRDLF